MAERDSLFERIVLLKGVRFFELLSTDQLRFLAAALEPVAWVAGDEVFLLGDPGDAMYIVISGRVGISLQQPPRCDDFVTRLGPGDCFGEMGLLEELPRSASACVLEDTEAYTLAKEKMLGLLLAYPELGLGMLRAMSRRIRELSRDLVKCKEAGAGQP